jgi:hypothetical protein
MNVITSRDNPLVKELRRLSQDSTAYRKLGRVWLEGDHLCRAALARGVRPEHAVFAQSQWDIAPRDWTEAAPRNTVLPDALFAEVSGLESPARMGFVMTVPVAPDILRHTPTVVLARCWPSKVLLPCGLPKSCALPWARILVCIWWRGWSLRRWTHWTCLGWPPVRTKAHSCTSCSLSRHCPCRAPG